MKKEKKEKKAKSLLKVDCKHTIRAIQKLWISFVTLSQRRGEREGASWYGGVKVIKQWVISMFLLLSCLSGEKDYWEQDKHQL